MEYLAAATVFAAVFLLLLSLQGGDSAVRARLEGLRQQPQPDQSEEQLTLSQRIFAPLTQSLVLQLKRLLPTKMLDGLQRKLVTAGDPMTLNGFLTFQLITAGAFFLLPTLIIGSGMMQVSMKSLAFFIGFSLVGVALPHLWLRSRVSQRQTRIVKSLPDSFDLITTCAEAGLGLDAALARVAEKVEGPFADELGRMLRDIALGKMRREALRELGERTGVPDIVSFVNAIIQAESMGSSIGTVLRVQADQLRVRRRQRAEEKAYKAPIKMIFPLVLCIFPTLFIVILGPAVITIMDGFSPP